jgi:hypothetical protein
MGEALQKNKIPLMQRIPLPPSWKDGEGDKGGEVDKNLLSRLIGRIFIALTRFTSK